MSKPILLIFILLFGFSANAQRMLYLKKQHSPKRHTVHMYDVIKVKTIQDSVFTGQILDISPDMIMLDDTYIKINEIAKLKTYDTFSRSVGKGLQKGSVLFAAIFIANGFITGDRPLLTEGNWYFIGGLLISGILIELLAGKVHRMDKWSIEVLDFSGL